MPWIRRYLGLPDDDAEVVRYWLHHGIDNDEIPASALDHSKPVVCVAAGPSVEQEFKRFHQVIDTEEVNIIAADGASEFLYEQGITPQIIVTDLDGITLERLEEYMDRTFNIYVLAHGDNRAAVATCLPLLRDSYNTVWTTQGQPLSGWVNTTGFTDGDRALALATQVDTPIFAVGYDLNTSEIGRYSKPPYRKSRLMTRRKSKKLDIARRVILWLGRTNRVYTMDSKKCPGIEYSPRDIPHIIE